jgi:hypothetical protein
LHLHRVNKDSVVPERPSMVARLRTRTSAYWFCWYTRALDNRTQILPRNEFVLAKHWTVRSHEAFAFPTSSKCRNPNSSTRTFVVRPRKSMRSRILRPGSIRSTRATITLFEGSATPVGKPRVRAESTRVIRNKLLQTFDCLPATEILRATFFCNEQILCLRRQALLYNEILVSN